MPTKIFISYRRDDDPAAAARVCDGLARRFGKSNLFMDVDNLLAGQRFDEELARALAACDIFIAVIGARWLGLMKGKIDGRERDYVREEIAAALMRRIVVIPVRVGREGNLPVLPRPSDLPSDIRELVHYQKHDVAHERFGRDIAELVDAITVVHRTHPTYFERFVAGELPPRPTAVRRSPLPAMTNPPRRMSQSSVNRIAIATAVVGTIVALGMISWMYFAWRN